MNKYIFKKICAFQTPISLAVLISFIGLYLCAKLSRLGALVACLAVAAVLTLWIHLVYAREKEFTRPDRHTVGFLIGFFAVMGLSLTGFSVRSVQAEGMNPAAKGALWAAAVFFAFFLFETVYMILIMRRVTREPRKKWAWLRFIPIAVLGVILVLTNLEIFGAWPRWDSYEYFYYLSELDYSGITVMDNLRPANHAAYGCSVVYLILSGIIGDALRTLYSINLLMLLAGTYGVWRILVKLFPKWNPVAHAIVSCLYAFSPFTFGLIWTINLEAFLAFGLVLFFWGKVEEMPTIQVLAAIMICFSKETGAVLLAAIMVAHLVLNFVLKCNRGVSFFKRLELPLTVPVLGCGILWLYDFVTNNWMGSNDSKIETVDQIQFNTLGVNPTYMQDRILSVIFTSFTWLLLAVALIGFAVGLIRKRRADSDMRKYFLVEAVVGLLASLIPLLFFITYNHIRYAGTFVILLILILPEALDRMFAGCTLRSAVSGLLAACTLAQCYFTVDPMMYVLYGSLAKGEGDLIFTDNEILVEGSSATSIAVNSQYNREIMYFDESFDEILAAIDYDHDTILVVSMEYMEPTVGGFVYAEYLITGFGYSRMASPLYMAWDPETESRYLSENPEDEILIYYTASGPQAIQDGINLFERCVYLDMPFSDPEIREWLLGGFNCEQIAVGDVNGWGLVAYEVTNYPAATE